MGRGKSQGSHGEPISSYGRRQALQDGVLAEAPVTKAPAYLPLFATGTTVVTPGAQEVLDALGITSDELINRHITGDWGDIHPEDNEAQLNEKALESGERIFSVYKIGPEDAKQTLWVITDAETDACPRCHSFYGGPPDPSCEFCHGTEWGEKAARLTTTVLTPDDY